MKKGKATILTALVLFICVSLGFFLGRNTIRKPVFESSIPSAKAINNTLVHEDTSKTSSPGQININTASSQQLQMLPNIGEVLAERIIEYRESFGPFTNVEDLMLVEGIGEKRIEALREYVTIGG